MENKLCYVCSPYRGDMERNTAYARELTLAAVKAGYAPITPHLYLTQVLDEEDPQQREKGMAVGLALLKNCKYILIGSRYGLSEGMLGEIDRAIEGKLTELALTKNGIEIVYGGEVEEVDTAAGNGEVAED